MGGNCPNSFMVQFSSNFNLDSACRKWMEADNFFPRFYWSNLRSLAFALYRKIIILSLNYSPYETL